MTEPQRRSVDLSGSRFGRLRVIGRAERAGRRLAWHCVCDCGAQKTVVGEQLKSGRTVSCGCHSRDAASARQRSADATMPDNTKHGHGSARAGTRTRTYVTWMNMVQRCTNPRNPAWRRYGGRGITICGRWRVFENFLADMGERPEGLTIDRIDNDRGYEPGNCRWATWVQQANNRRRAAV